MDNLEKFFKNNRSKLCDERILKGDVERFEQKYEESRRIKFVSPIKRKRFSFWKAVLFPVVASLAIVAFIYLIFNTKSFNEQPVNSYMVYKQYYKDAALLIEDISKMTATLTKEEALHCNNTVEAIMSEPIPIADVLPEEIGEKQKVEIVSYYASVQLNALKRYKQLLAK